MVSGKRKSVAYTIFQLDGAIPYLKQFAKTVILTVEDRH